MRINNSFRKLVVQLHFENFFTVAQELLQAQWWQTLFYDFFLIKPAAIIQ